MIYRIGAIAVSILAGVSAWQMLVLYREEQLWGHWPLVFLLFLWTALVLFSQWIRRPDAGAWRRLGLSTLSGVLLAGGFPPVPASFLLLVAFVPLLYVFHDLSRLEKPAGRAIFWHSYHAFVVWNILTTWWVCNSTLIAGLFAIFVNALLMTIPVMLGQAVRRQLPQAALASLAVFWITFEHLHLRWELSWPWLTLGNGLASLPAMAQWYEYTGVLGGSAWIWTVNILVFGLLWQRSTGRWVRLALAVLGPIGLSLGLYFTWQEQGNPVEVTVVQPNYEPHYEKFATPDRAQLERILQISRERLSASTDYLVLPETAFGSVEDQKIGQDATGRALKELLREYPGLQLVSGYDLYHIFREGAPHSPYVREMKRRDGSVIYWEAYNAAVQLSADSAEVPVYRKSKLVPGAESFPFKKALFFLEPLVDALGGSTAGLATQPRRAAFAGRDGVRVAPIICYESVFGEYHTGYIRAGATLGFIMTNDGWWDNSAGHKQHLAYASLRAIETRRAIARSANTGISAFIDQRGRLLQTLGYGQTGALNGVLLSNQTITFYVRWGDMTGRIALFSSIILGLGLLKRRFKQLI